jgi:hypothetical protein
MLKTKSQIAHLTCLNWETISRSVLKLNIEPALVKGKTNYYDQYQVDLILDHLWFDGKLEFMIFESKMNVPDFEIYSRENLISSGTIVPTK